MASVMFVLLGVGILLLMAAVLLVDRVQVAAMTWKGSLFALVVVTLTIISIVLVAHGLKGAPA